MWAVRSVHLSLTHARRGSTFGVASDECPMNVRVECVGHGVGGGVQLCAASMICRGSEDIQI